MCEFFFHSFLPRRISFFSNSFRNKVTDELCLQITHTHTDRQTDRQTHTHTHTHTHIYIYIYKKSEFCMKNPQGLICRKALTNQIKLPFLAIFSPSFSFTFLFFFFLFFFFFTFVYFLHLPFFSFFPLSFFFFFNSFSFFFLHSFFLLDFFFFIILSQVSMDTSANIYIYREREIYMKFLMYSLRD